MTVTDLLKLLIRTAKWFIGTAEAELKKHEADQDKQGNKK